ncbi:hypothetical protein Tco_0172462 [Tanacetum coccineum]
MYEKIKRSDEDFIAIGSVEDDRLIKRMNKKDSSKGEEIKQESKEEVKEEDKGEENTRKRSTNDELRLCLTIAPNEDKEVDYEILDKKYPIIDWKTENLGTKPQFDESKRSEEINMNVVTRSNGQKRCFSTLIRVLSVFDREDLDALVVQDQQNVLVKILKNLLLADSLLNTLWFINAPCYDNEALASPNTNGIWKLLSRDGKDVAELLKRQGAAKEG